jgi:hypothetical protein
MKIKKYFILLLLAGFVFSCSSDDDPEPVAPPVQSTAADILTFTMTEETGAATINASAATVEIEVESGTDLTSLSPAFTVSTGASASPASGTSGNYSSEVTITVTAEDGTTTKAWSVDVSEASDVLSSETDILTFSLPEETGDATIDDTVYTIAIEVANGTDLSMLTPAFTISDGATASPATGTQGNYSSAVTITVTAEDGVAMQAWTVNVTEASGGGLSMETDILSFSFPEETGAATIDDTAHTIAIEVANGTDLTMLTPAFTISDGATASPATGTQGNYSSAVTITVTAEDATTIQAWTVNVSEAAGGGGGGTGATTVEFGDGGTIKATAIRNLVVDGVTYDVIFRQANANELYGAYPGTFTFNTDGEATVAVSAINAALDTAGASRVGEAGAALDEPRYKIGFNAFLAGPTENCRTKLGIEQIGWIQGPEESSLWNDDQTTWAEFIAL